MNRELRKQSRGSNLESFVDGARSASNHVHSSEKYAFQLFNANRIVVPIALELSSRFRLAHVGVSGVDNG